MPYAFVGPGELIVSNACVLSYDRFLGLPVVMVCFEAGSSNVVNVTVPEGKRIQFLLPNDSTDEILKVMFIGGQRNITVTDLRIGQVFDGPLFIQFDSKWAQPALAGVARVYAAYWFVEDVFENPNVLKVGRTAVPAISVERSADMTNWTPAAIIRQPLDGSGFYRLKAGSQ
jgi:hypothetical protein